MPPRIPRAGLDLSKAVRWPIALNNQPICPICTISRTSRPTIPTKRTREQLSKHQNRTREQSTATSASIANGPHKAPSKTPRTELRDALLDLQKHATSYINISRLQLAIRSLEQPEGQETIRIAILGLADGEASSKKARELVRLLLADPLKEEEEWERILMNNQPGSKPLLLRVGHNGAEESGYSNNMVQELNVSSPMLNGHKLEILVLETDSLNAIVGESGTFTDSLLVPSMDIPTSNTGRYTPITTPVHKSLLFSQGIIGASALISTPFDTDSDLVGATVDIQISKQSEISSLPFQIINISLGSSALSSFRESVNNALDYEHNWFASGVPEVLEWLKTGTSPIDGTTKLPVRKLIGSLLQNTELAIRTEEAARLNKALSAKVSTSNLDSLRRALSEWGERAHTELQDKLDIAFNGRRWRKLGWWKLFWRVDDVSMISSDILNQRFLIDAEKEAIFLAGRTDEAGIFKQSPEAIPEDWAYKMVRHETPEQKEQAPQHRFLLKDLAPYLPDGEPGIKNQPWPLNIPVSRRYLATETIPALQALAQKLVLQTITTSSFVSAFAALTYVSTLSTGLYEAGAIAAVGVVWSLRRMQIKWETARKFWEGEVREEGRKAVRGVENTIGTVLKPYEPPVIKNSELEKAKEVVERAIEKLEVCK